MSVSAEACPVDLADGLSRAGDDPAFYRELLDLFLVDARERLDGLVTALAAGNLAEVAATAHSIKGAAANLSAERARELAYAIERGGRAGDPTGLARLARELSEEIDRVAAFATGYAC